MNKARRKRVDEAYALITRASEILGEAYEEEQEYYDNMPESIQAGQRGDATMEILGWLEETIGHLEEAAATEPPT